MGSAKAPVLPDPVSASPIRSRPKQTQLNIHSENGYYTVFSSCGPPLSFLLKSHIIKLNGKIFVIIRFIHDIIIAQTYHKLRGDNDIKMSLLQGYS